MRIYRSRRSLVTRLLAAVAGVAAVGVALAGTTAAQAATPVGRFADTSPFFAGASLNNGGGKCTSGVPMTIGGVPFMSTAAHCFANNNLVWSGPNTSSHLLGLVSKIKGNVDTELIQGRYNAGVWSGGTATSLSSLAISGWATPTLNRANVCTSGQSTLMKCGRKIISTGLNSCGANKTYCVTNAFYLDGEIGQPGDSGGPIFFVDSNHRAVILGLMKGTASGRTVGIPIGDVLSAFGGKLIAAP